MSRRAKRAIRPNPREERNFSNYKRGRTNYNSKEQDNVIELHFPQAQKKKKVEIIPRNLAQEELLVSLEDENKNIVFATGPAGTGKTYLATLYAIKQLRTGQCDKIIIARPNIALDDQDIGFLPGDIIKKMSPWTRPVLAIFEEFYNVKEITHMIEENIIELLPLAYVRGLTFKNTVVILDEAQNTTKASMLGILTRIGENSKLIITGDTKQTDRGSANGLSDFLERFKGSDRIDVCRFERKDIERHPVISEILQMYGEE